MASPMRTRDEQIAAIRADQRFWRDIAAEVGEGRYALPGPMGEWSFGEMAGHLLGWRKRTIARLEAFARGEPAPPDPWPAGLDDDDAVNDWIRAQHRDRSPVQLVSDYDASYDRLVAIIEALPEAKLTRPVPDAIPGNEEALVEIDFTGHLHDEHVPAVRAWLARGA